MPVVETMAGKSTLVADHPLYAGPIGVTGCPQANALAAEADVVLAVGTRLQDFTTGSWTVFGNEDLRIVGLNAARFDAAKHRSLPLVCDALEGLEELGSALGGWAAPEPWREETRTQAARVPRARARSRRTAPGRDRALLRAGHRGRQRRRRPRGLRGLLGRRLPGRAQRQLARARRRDLRLRVRLLVHGLRARGRLGASMARPLGEVFAFVGDGSYLMLNSELLSSVISGHKLIAVLCDNGGFAVIERLQVGQGGASFNNMFDGDRAEQGRGGLGRARARARLRGRARRRRSTICRRRWRAPGRPTART